LTNLLQCLVFAVAAAASAAAGAAEVLVAVAANFTAPAQKIAQAFEKASGHKARLAFGSTGRFHAQIANGAPFDVLLAADEETPQSLARLGLAVADSRFTYAVGRLVLWSWQAGLVDSEGQVLQNGRFDKIAMADPKLAPYGAAALEAMKRLGVLNRLQTRLVQGESIAQTYQFVASQNAQLGFVAMSQVFENGQLASGSAWVVPQSLHAPIRQDAILLKKGVANPAAVAFLGYLRSQPARDAIRLQGYALCDGAGTCAAHNLAGK
jgi:molybdate transport system substrate-binding protein